MSKISLCLITGNCAEYIERCLNSFLPIADEVCLVRAIGNQTPDATLDIARETCLGFFLRRNRTAPDGFLKISDYLNKPDHQHWPHIDDFAAARQQSFDMATGDYCFWCDTDDLLESGADIIRQLADRGGYPAFLFPYKIFGRGIILPRERMTIRGGGRWRFPVHECYTFPTPIQAIQDDRVIITHLPHLDKNGSNDRNLRILESIAESEMTAGLWYHLYGALCSAGRKLEAVQAAKKAIAHPDIGTPEKYELYIDLARMSHKPEVKASFLHQAYATDPKRREALGLLTGNALDYGHNQEALAYARQMMATEKPADESWNDRHPAYTWLGIEIYTQALRMNGHTEHAEALRRRALHEAGGPTIALLHATRGRPQQAAHTRKLWMDMAAQPDRIEHIFIFDADDEASRPLRRMHHLEIFPGGCVSAWNNGAMTSTAPVFLQLSDDWVPIPQWDKIILDRLGDLTKPAVLAISDGHRQDKLLCMAICTRAYWEQDYFLFHPRFTGVYSDNYFTDRAYARGQVIQARDIIFTHNHPAFGSADVDETYASQNSRENYHHGKTVYDDLTANPRADFSSVPGFCNYWPFYQHIARKLQDGDTFVEIGCWLGRSIIFLAQELQRQKKNVNLFVVDHFKGESNQKEHQATVTACGGNLRPAFEANLARCHVADRIQIIEGDSADSAQYFADRSVAACFIDAAHDYESVRRDLQAWQPKIKPDGILSGHDADYPDVARAISELDPKPTLLGCVWIASPSSAAHGSPLPGGEGSPGRSALAQPGRGEG